MARKFNPGRIGEISRLQIIDNTFNSIIPNEDIMIMPNGTGNVNLGTDTLRIGDQNGNAILTTWGTGDLTIHTNAGSNSGTITIPDGNNQSITITPSGTGDVRLNADTTRIGDQNANTTLTTWGTGDLTLSTNAGSNSGTITILDGSGQDIRIYPNGGGNIRLGQNTNSEVILTATTETSSTGNGALVVPGGIGVAKQIRTGGTVTIGNGSLVLSGTGRIQGVDTVSSDTDAANKNYADLVGGLDWTLVTTNTTMTPQYGYFVNTGSAAITMTLPSSPAAGTRIRIVDYARNFGTNACTVSRNGQNIMGVAENLTLDVNEINLELVYITGTGWWITNIL